MTPKEIAAKLTPAQRGLLDDVCRLPGLFAGLHEYDGAPIERLPMALWRRSYEGASGFLGLAKAYPTELGFLVRSELETNNVE